MRRLIGLVMRKGWRRGVLGGSRPWLIAGILAFGVNLMQRLAAKEPQVVYREELAPGEAVLIRHLGPEGVASSVA
jgi:hypothetical protein